MARMTSRFAGSCAICGRRFPAGADIDYDKSMRAATHWACKQSEKPIPTDVKTYQIGGGSGYGCRGWKQGQIVRSPARDIEERGYPPYLLVLQAKSQYFREDGMSFGVGDDQGYMYSAICREATAEEAAPKIAAERHAATIKNAKASLAALAKQIDDQGERPTDNNNVDGERLFDTATIYGGGDWFVLQPDWVWHVRNNGGDGDMWDLNNVRTGGAGAIGRRVPRTEQLVAALYALRDLLGTQIEDEARERELLAMVEDAKYIKD